MELQYDPTGALMPGTGITGDDLTQLEPRLAAARDEVLADVELWQSDAAVPTAKEPLDAGFFELPENLLKEYKTDPRPSELGHILRTAGRLSETVDRVVVLGIGGSYMGARALMDACCHPFHNELDRSERGGRPRIYFEGNNVDNDAMRALLDLISHEGEAARVEDRWAIVVVSKSGGTLETAVALRVFLATLQNACGGDERRLAECVVPVTGPSGRLFELASALGCPDRFLIPEGVGGRFSVFTAVGLLPAALMGLDVVRLLQGAATMNHYFRTAAPAENIVLQYVAIGHLLEIKSGVTLRVLSAWSKTLESIGLWYDQLLAESLGKQERGPTPITVVNTRDLHSRGQQHQEGRRDKLITNLIVDRVRADRISVGHRPWDYDQLNALADKSLPDIMDAAVLGTNRAYAEDGRPTTDLRLPELNEHTIGQLLQLLMLATVVEGRLIGINPYGQPGVEAYKRHMNEALQ